MKIRDRQKRTGEGKKDRPERRRAASEPDSPQQEKLKESPSSKMSTLIEQAGRRFDLNPMQQEALFTWLTKNPDSTPE